MSRNVTERHEHHKLRFFLLFFCKFCVFWCCESGEERERNKRKKFLMMQELLKICLLMLICSVVSCDYLDSLFCRFSCWIIRTFTGIGDGILVMFRPRTSFESLFQLEKKFGRKSQKTFKLNQKPSLAIHLRICSASFWELLRFQRNPISKQREKSNYHSNFSRTSEHLPASFGKAFDELSK